MAWQPMEALAMFRKVVTSKPQGTVSVSAW